MTELQPELTHLSLGEVRSGTSGAVLGPMVCNLNALPQHTHESARMLTP